MKKVLMIFLLALVIISSTTSPAAAADSNATAAVALFIDTSGHYIPGVDILNKALNEVIRFKINVLLLGSEVQSGNEVLRDLNRCNVNSAADATLEELAKYGTDRHVNYIVLVSVRPLDVALDLKAYSTADNAYIVDKSVTRPDGTETASVVDTLSDMVGNEVAQVLQTIHGS
ncbi:hypothetical protein SPSIL_033350 [Sporomusa silvacetica DSM 10669]|uniref:Uncharacterized protein n=1 Tax=Sporomusa silvacetica DSM 10669 TaxID=1123289 RepID=A0ABZ3INA0_9FIRM|nr:hypothetical protein [Sporomusa silvacetica]OZC15081.1 hypothetical protein SPSIL_43260 [Sporomusa silvacetica DSM 10669]